MKIMKLFCYENLEPYNIVENPAAQEAICKKWACAACIVASTTLILLCDLNLHVKIWESQKNWNITKVIISDSELIIERIPMV